MQAARLGKVTGWQDENIPRGTISYRLWRGLYYEDTLDMNTVDKNHFILVLVVLTGLLLQGTLAAKQDTGADSPAVQEASSLGKDGDDLLKRIDSLQQQAETYRSDVKKTEGEARAAIFLQIVTQEDELRSALDDLVDLIKEQDESGLDTGALTSRVKQFLADQAITIWQDIKLVGKTLRQFNETDQTEMPDEEIEELKQNVTHLNRYLDMLYTDAYENIERRKNLDLDFAADLENLQTSLGDRGKFLAGYVELAWRQITSIENRIDKLPATGADSGAKGLQADLYLLEEKQQSTVESLTATLDLMDRAGLDTSEYRLLLIRATGNVSEHIFNTKVVVGLIAGLYDGSLEWLDENGPAILLKLVIILSILLVAKIFAALAARLVRKAILKSQLSLSTLLQDFFVSMASKAVMLIGFLIVLSQLGVQIGPALAGLGVAGFIVGFALQETLANFASGLMILMYRPFDVGDQVEVAGVTGQVRLMSLVSTSIVTFDNQRLVVPNTKIWGDVIRNVTAEKNRRVDMVFGIGYEDDIASAEKILTEIVKSHELVLKEPEPSVKLHTLGESSVDFIVRPWVLTDDYWTVYWDITRAVKDRFDREGISIPYPQRDVHMHQIPANPPPVEL